MAFAFFLTAVESCSNAIFCAVSQVCLIAALLGGLAPGSGGVVGFFILSTIYPDRSRIWAPHRDLIVTDRSRKFSDPQFGYVVS